MPGTTRDLLEQGRDAIRDVEEHLKRLLLKAVEETHHDSVAELNEYVRDLRRVLDKDRGSSTLRDATVDISSSPNGYPKFFKSNDKLVMIGWSKKGRTEYKHEAPKSLLHLLVISLVGGSSNGEFVPIDDLLALKDPETGAEFPQYQIRVFVRWLRNIGIVTKQGHRGYSIRDSDGVESTVKSCWRRLRSR